MKQLACEGLLELARSVQNNEEKLNERHIHHAFSHMLQSEGLSLDVRWALV